MMMQCPRCSTRWRVAAASPVENPLFKCGRCHHLFRQFPGAPPPSEATTSTTRRIPAEQSEPDTLEFIFPERPSAEIIHAKEPEVPALHAGPMAPADDVSTDLHEATVAIPAAPVTVSREPAVEERANHDMDFASDDEDFADGDEDEGHELGSDLLAEPADDDGPVLGDLDEDDGPDTTVMPETRRSFRVEEPMKTKTPAGFGTVIRALGVAVSGFAALALIMRVAPERTSAWLSRVPVVGAGFAHDRNLTRKVELKNVHGQFQRLRNARRVFVISGDARNNSALTIDRIEVAGALYGLGGGELDQKIVTTGNRTALTDLSEAEIVLLQRLDPAIALAPGETTPFLIVFLEPPRELREFSSRVLTVRPTRRASSPPPPPAGSSQGSVG